MRDETKNPFVAGKLVGVNIIPEDYHRPNAARGAKDLVVGRSDLLEVLCNPHRWVNGYERNGETEATEWGNLMDCKVMSPQQFKDRYAIRPDNYPDEKGQMKPWHGASKWCKQWMEDHAGKEVVSKEKNTESDNALKFLYGDAEAREFIKCSAKQVMAMAIYKDPETGVEVPVKTLIDLLPDKAHPDFGKSIGDYKTTTNGHPFPWTRDVHKYGYTVQAAFYLDVYLAAVPGEDRLEFRHIAQESMPPWEVCKRILSQEFLEIGRRKYLEALELYAKCLATNTWPNYEREMPGRTIVNGWLIVGPEPWMTND